MPPYYFYELHESDTDLFADVLLAHETEYDEAEFLELVLEAREKVLDRFEADSLIEAVAVELSERAGFLIIDDSQLRVAVNVSASEDEARSARTSTGWSCGREHRAIPSARCSWTWSLMTPPGACPTVSESGDDRLDIRWAWSGSDVEEDLE